FRQLLISPVIGGHPERPELVEDTSDLAIDLLRRLALSQRNGFMDVPGSIVFETDLDPRSTERPVVGATDRCSPSGFVIPSEQLLCERDEILPVKVHRLVRGSSDDF